MEGDASSEVKNVGQRIRYFPGIGEVAMNDHLVVAFDEAAEEQSVEMLRLPVGGEAGVEIGGIGFDQEIAWMKRLLVGVFELEWWDRLVACCLGIKDGS